MTNDACNLVFKDDCDDSLPATKSNTTKSLPPRRKTNNKLLQAKCRVILKKINGLTYLIKDIGSLTKLEKQLQEIFKEMEQMVKSDKGILLESENRQKRKAKKKRKSTTSTTQEDTNVCGKPKKRLRKEIKKVKGNLPEQKYGRPCRPYYKRVGSHAEMMKKTLQDLMYQ